jgi:transketolase
MEPLEDKWKAFGWDTQTADGHSHADIYKAIEKAKQTPEKPHAVILNTIKAKGVAGFEGTDHCHHIPVDDKTFDTVLAGLK